MPIITATQVASYLDQTFTTSEEDQANLAIDQAIAVVSELLGYNIDPVVPTADAIPSQLSVISAGSCGTISSGKFKRFPVHRMDLITVDPFYAIRQIILVQSGRIYTGTNTCTSGITFVLPYQYDVSLSGDFNAQSFNQIALCSGCVVNCDCGVEGNCNTVYIDADWGWHNAYQHLPAALKSMLLGITADLLNVINANGLKSENIEGHSYTYSDKMEQYAQKYASIISKYGTHSNSFV